MHGSAYLEVCHWHMSRGVNYVTCSSLRRPARRLPLHLYTGIAALQCRRLARSWESCLQKPWASMAGRIMHVAFLICTSQAVWKNGFPRQRLNSFVTSRDASTRKAFRLSARRHRAEAGCSGSSNMWAAILSNFASMCFKSECKATWSIARAGPLHLNMPLMNSSRVTSGHYATWCSFSITSPEEMWLAASLLETRITKQPWMWVQEQSSRAAAAAAAC